MLLPVIDRFAECGWQPFVEPAETYEFFTVSGVFKRAHIETRAHAAAQQHGAQHLVQRNALFDVCLRSGLSHLIVAYIAAVEPQPAGAVAADALVGKHYVLKEPIAVQQWVRRHVEALEKRLDMDLAEVADEPASRSAKPALTEHAAGPPAEASIRELSGLRAIAMALVERLQEGSRHLARSRGENDSNSPNAAAAASSLQDTELARLTSDGIQTLLELIFRIQALLLSWQSLQWLQTHGLTLHDEALQEFYYDARTARAAQRQGFEGSYQVVFSSISNSDISHPSLLIELVLQRANPGLARELGGIPPRRIRDLLHVLRSPQIHEEIAAFYGDEVSLEPVEDYFRVQVALLLYFALDLAYLQAAATQPQAWTGAELVRHLTDIAESFAAQLGVRADMKSTLLALWLVENATNVRLRAEDEAAALYHSAITGLLESTAVRLHQRDGLESDVILYLAETLVQRGESPFAWKIWTAFDLDLDRLPPVATEYAIMVNLELGAWERALSILRRQHRGDLVSLVFKWLVKNRRMKELVQSATLDGPEETAFEDFMMGGRMADDRVLNDESIRKADLLVMYYVLRNRFRQAWAVHHEHLALIRESTSGNTNVAHAVLTQPSFKVRVALLENMKAEPTDRPTTYAFKQGEPATKRPDDDLLMMTSASVTMGGLPPASDDEMMGDDGDAKPPSPNTTSAPSHAAAAFDADSGAYSPGIFSSRAALPRTSSGKKQSQAPKSSEHPVEGRHVPIGTIDSSPESAARHRGANRRHSLEPRGRRAAQSLDFGGAADETPAISRHDRRKTLTPPMRSRFHAAFSSYTGAGAGTGTTTTTMTTTDELALKPRGDGPTTPAPAPSVSTHAASDRLRARPHPPASTIAASASLPPAAPTSTFETPRRFSFVREAPQSDSRVLGGGGDGGGERSPATQELEAMELELIDEEFSTPSSSTLRPGSTEPQSAPVRRNPRRSSRLKY